MSGTFYRTYRPQKFSELVGQELIRRTLEQAVKEEKIAHAYLFTGPRGTGKTTTARILAKAINCLTPLAKRTNGEPCNSCQNCLSINGNKTLDLVEIDAASYTGVDNIRQLTENIDLSPASLRYRVFIIDEVHMLSKGAFNALLKTLEEPPSHTVFVLATTEQHKVPLTITSRCQRFSFRLLTLPEILKKLKKIAENEKIDIDNESLEIISETAHGGMRDAESLFAQVATLAGKKIKYSETREILGVAGREDEIKLLDSIFNNAPSDTWEILDQLKNEGVDAFLLSHRILDYLRKILLLKVNSKGAKIIEREISEKQLEKLSTLSKNISSTDLINFMAKIVQTQPLIKSSSYPYLPLELKIVEWGMDKIPNSQLPISNEIISSPPNSTENNKNKKIKKTDKPPIAENTNSLTRKLVNSKTANKIANLSDIKATTSKITPANLKSVLNKWTAVLQNIRDVQPALFSLLKVCSPVRVEGETLVIATPFKFHKDKLNDGRNKSIFCQELEKVVGIKRICVVQDSAVSNGDVKDDELLDQVKDLLGP